MNRRIVISFLACLALAGLVGWWRCSFGSISPDGAFVLVEPWRFAGGDLPFKHEWHLSVFYGMLVAPLLWLYRNLIGLEAGTFLWTSRLVLLFWMLTLLFVWNRWRKISLLGACLGAMAIAFFPPWGGFGFGYNKFGVMTIMLAITFYATTGRWRTLDLVLAGVFLACGIMCCPHMALLYVLFFIYAIMKNRRELVFVSIGCALVGCVVLTWLLSNVAISEIQEALPCMLADPQHKPRGIVVLIRDFVGHLFFVTHDYAYGHAALMVGVCLSIGLAWIDKRREAHFKLYLTMIVGFILSLYVYYRVQPMVCLNPLMLLLPLMALWGGAFLDLKQSCGRGLFVAMVSGFVYVFAISCSSNMGLYAMSFAAEVAMVPAVVLLAVVLSRFGRGPVVVLATVLVIHMGLILEAAAVKPMMRDAASLQVIAEGPHKGRRFAKRAADTCDRLYRDTESIRANPRVKNVLYLDHPNQWLYLASDKGVGAYSSWLSGVSTNSLDRLDAYWKQSPEKMPEAIFVTEENRYLENILISRYGFNVDVLPSGNSILWKSGVK